MVVYSCFNSLDRGCFPSSFFFGGQLAILIGPHKHKPETLVAPQNKSFHWQMECLPLGPAIKLRRGELWAKHME